MKPPNEKNVYVSVRGSDPTPAGVHRLSTHSKQAGNPFPPADTIINKKSANGFRKTLKKSPPRLLQSRAVNV
jgi:hypothetical protein